MANCNRPALREPKCDCINYIPGKVTAYGGCKGLKELICVTELKECPFYKSNRDYYSDGRPRKG